VESLTILLIFESCHSTRRANDPVIYNMRFRLREGCTKTCHASFYILATSLVSIVLRVIEPSQPYGMMSVMLVDLPSEDFSLPLLCEDQK
jgi:hypothetical protein